MVLYFNLIEFKHLYMIRLWAGYGNLLSCFGGPDMG